MGRSGMMGSGRGHTAVLALLLAFSETIILLEARDVDAIDTTVSELGTADDVFAEAGGDLGEAASLSNGTSANATKAKAKPGGLWGPEEKVESDCAKLQGFARLDCEDKEEAEAKKHWVHAWGSSNGHPSEVPGYKGPLCPGPLCPKPKGGKGKGS